MRQFVAHLGELFERTRASRPLSGPGLGATRQAHLPEQDIAELLGASWIDLRSRDLVDLLLQRGLFLAELLREARKHGLIDRYATFLHARKDLRQRPFEGVVDGSHAFGHHARLQRLPEPQRHVGVFGDIAGGARDRCRLRGEQRPLSVFDVIETGRAAAEIAVHQGVHVVRALTGVKHVGHQHGVVDSGDAHSAAGQHQPVLLHVVTDLDDAEIFQDGLQRRERVLLGNLTRAELGREQTGIGSALVPGFAMAERKVGRLIRRNGERDPAQLGLHRINAADFSFQREETGIVGARDPVLEPVERSNRLVFCMLELRGAQRFDASLSERDGREATFLAYGSGFGCGKVAEIELSRPAARRGN